MVNKKINDTQEEKKIEAIEEKPNIENLYKRLKAVSFSAKMGDDLKFLIQGDCINEESSKYLKSLISGLITVGKLKSAGQKNQKGESLLDHIKLERYGTSVFIELLINKGHKVIRFPLTGYWIDIGKHEDYKKAQDVIKHLEYVFNSTDKKNTIR